MFQPCLRVRAALIKCGKAAESHLPGPLLAAGRTGAIWERLYGLALIASAVGEVQISGDPRMRARICQDRRTP